MFLACVVENGGAFILAISVKNEPLNFHNDARKKRNDQKQKKICPRNDFFNLSRLLIFVAKKNNYTSILLIISKKCPSRPLN